MTKYGAAPFPGRVVPDWLLEALGEPLAVARPAPTSQTAELSVEMISLLHLVKAGGPAAVKSSSANGPDKSLVCPLIKAAQASVSSP